MRGDETAMAAPVPGNAVLPSAVQCATVARRPLFRFLGWAGINLRRFVQLLRRRQRRVLASTYLQRMCLHHEVSPLLLLLLFQLLKHIFSRGQWQVYERVGRWCRPRLREKVERGCQRRARLRLWQKFRHDGALRARSHLRRSISLALGGSGQ
jgi:hypothetical protein